MKSNHSFSGKLSPKSDKLAFHFPERVGVFFYVFELLFGIVEKTGYRDYNHLVKFLQLDFPNTVILTF